MSVVSFVEEDNGVFGEFDLKREILLIKRNTVIEFTFDSLNHSMALEYP